MRRFSGSFVLGALVMACGSSGSSPSPSLDGAGDSSVRSDAGDSGKALDAHALDAATPREGAASHDGGTLDAGREGGIDAQDATTGGHDAGTLDASTLDGSTDAGLEGHDGAAEGGAVDASEHDALHGEDGAKDAAAHDASVSHDAEHDAGVAIVTCGGATCYAGQSCVGGVCETTDCVGVHVPGDYATVQAAATALGMLPAGGTICLGAQTYVEYVVGKATGGLVKIQGMGPAVTTVEYFAASSGSWALEGLTLFTVSDGPANALSITNAVIDAPTNGDYGILLTGSASGTISLSGVDIEGNGADEGIAFSTGTTASLFVDSSYIHGAETGIASLVSGNVPTVHVMNSTFANNGDALQLDMAQGPGGAPVAAVYNSLFLNNGTGINLSNAGIAGHNAFYGNFADYSGLAVAPTTGDVTTDPMVTNAGPPGLLAGSPCRGAGDPAHAAPVDFYGRPFGATPDIGAVQSTP
jgi:hypothetical protein